MTAQIKVSVSSTDFYTELFSVLAQQAKTLREKHAAVIEAIPVRSGRPELVQAADFRFPPANKNPDKFTIIRDGVEIGTEMATAVLRSILDGKTSIPDTDLASKALMPLLDRLNAIDEREMDRTARGMAFAFGKMVFNLPKSPMSQSDFDAFARSHLSEIRS